ncbi:hypothetical protein [Streptomyces sp. NBC_01190]|uniref:hypothetical protein n=1 Tax=Streptomyces sp. NBC_01190 TaxID=2903767 RepID=UPI0038634EC5|nr:hypothetical protein OG519_15745 [Streptomyces sp. NBC_01190]
MATSINGGVEQALAQQPVQKTVDGTQLGDTLTGATGTAQSLRQQTLAATVLGRTGDAVKSGGLSTVTGAMPGASLLGGLPFGGFGGA